VSGDPIDYSPDGKKITYTSYEGFNDGSPTGPQKDSEIYTIKVGGGGKTNVTNNNGYDWGSSYSPDGKRIAHSSWDGNDDEIYTINTDGTGTFQLTNNGTNDFTPSYSPDGKKIVYYTGSHLQHPDIYTINVGGGRKSKVTEGWTPSWGSRP
jgi:TolB protein